MSLRRWIMALLVLLVVLPQGAVPAEMPVAKAPEVAGQVVSNDFYFLRPGDVVLFLGNSITLAMDPEVNFLNADLKKQYPELAGKVKFPLSGYGGDVARYGFARLPKVVNEKKPTICVICYGTNESKWKTDESVFVPFMRLIIKFLKDNNVIPVVVAPPPLSGKIKFGKDDPFNNADMPATAERARKLAAETGVMFVDTFAEFKAADPAGEKEFTVDGVHLNPAGYRVMADALQKAWKYGKPLAPEGAPRSVPVAAAQAVPVAAKEKDSAVPAAPAASDAKPDGKSPLADMPSKPGAHLEKIKALGSNTWFNLGKPAADKRYGAAEGRSWSRKMAFAPDLRGAFIYGESTHGGSTVRGGKRYYNDDLFFYDINAHAWVCCYPGTLMDPPGPGLKFDSKTGLETDSEGNVLPVAVSVHAYWCPEYDTDRKMFMFMPSPASMFWPPSLGKYRPHIKDNDPRWSGGHSPYYYDSKTGKFERRRAASGCPGANVDNALFYSPKLKKAVYVYRGVWLYDYAANTWTRANEEDDRSGAYCYDSKRDQVYALTGPMKRDEKGERVPAGPNFMRVYDLTSNKWMKVESTGNPGNGAESYTAFFTYDSVNDIVLLHVNNRHHAYDPDTKVWTQLPSTQGNLNWFCSSAFYDPALNVHFYYNSGDGNTEPGNMWVYRYATGKQEQNKERK